MDNIQNVWTSAVNPKRSNKIASLWPEVHNFTSTPNGMMHTIWFYNWNFRVFHVNGKHPSSTHCLQAVLRKTVYIKQQMTKLFETRLAVDIVVVILCFALYIYLYCFCKNVFLLSKLPVDSYVKLKANPLRREKASTNRVSLLLRFINVK